MCVPMTLQQEESVTTSAYVYAKKSYWDPPKGTFSAERSLLHRLSCFSDMPCSCANKKKNPWHITSSTIPENGTRILAVVRKVRQNTNSGIKATKSTQNDSIKLFFGCSRWFCLPFTLFKLKHIPRAHLSAQSRLALVCLTPTLMPRLFGGKNSRPLNC